MPRKKQPRRQVVQRHHITYPDGRHAPPPEWVVPVTRGEHYAITQLQRFGSFTEGARAAILYLLATKPTRVLDQGDDLDQLPG